MDENEINQLTETRIAAARKQAELLQRIADLERQNALLRRAAEGSIALLDDIINWQIGITGEVGEIITGSVYRKRADGLYLAVAAAIDGGALESDEATSLRTAIQQAEAGDVWPVSKLWDEIDAGALGEGES